jgi:heat shock protein HslJ
MKSLLFLVCAVLLLGLLVAGCTNKAPVPTSVTIVRIHEPTTPVTIATTSPLTDPALLGPWLLKTGMKNNETLAVISNAEPTITFNNDGTFTVFGGCNYYKGNYILTGQTTELRKTIKLGPMSVISNVEPTITFNNDGTFTVFGGCTCYEGNHVLTGQTAELRKTIKLGPATHTAWYCAQTNYTETNYLQILQATETYSIRNNIEYMNLRTAAGEQIFFRSGNL